MSLSDFLILILLHIDFQLTFRALTKTYLNKLKVPEKVWYYLRLTWRGLFDFVKDGTFFTHNKPKSIKEGCKGPLVRSEEWCLNQSRFCRDFFTRSSLFYPSLFAIYRLYWIMYLHDLAVFSSPTQCCISKVVIMDSNRFPLKTKILKSPNFI